MNARLPNKNIIMLTDILKREKISGDLGNFYVNNWEDGGIIEMDTLYFISRDFQKRNKDPTGHKKQSQCNEPGLCPLVWFQNTKN